MRYRIVSPRLVGFKVGDLLPADYHVEPLLRAGLIEPVPDEPVKPVKPKAGK